MSIRALTVPQWSFGRDRVLIALFQEILGEKSCTVHYCQSDVDHNRTVTAFSGDLLKLFEAISRLMAESLESIDLNRHVGAHPRIGALDVCPFVLLGQPRDSEVVQLQMLVRQFAQRLAIHWEAPVYLYEKSEIGPLESELPSLRRGGFGGLIGKILRPDFGPKEVHPRWGVFTVGVRDFMLSATVSFSSDDGTQARRIAKLIRYLRMDGDARFLGVRAISMSLASLDQTQVKVELTMPNATTIDQILDWIIHEATCNGAVLAGTELIGPIRKSDVPNATRLLIQPEQIIEDCE